MITAFVDKFDSDDCNAGGEHDFSEAVLTFITRKGEHRHINQDHYLKYKKLHGRMRVIGGEGRCSKCKCLYTQAHNPFFM